ncbi:hypothetical protein KIW84_021320 [Lathyrus oleraceus]|uniref:Uncharacterized protein n=1 Tax=Pisum sativum TaxID=3888 RepID=A0A9D4YD73_PEA|nr:hypothetical protein KIW84_021320 [Pisum sativum]
MTVPSHVLYADDIMVFCKGGACSIQAIKTMFQSLESQPFIYRGQTGFGKIDYPKVSYYISNREWSFPQSIVMIFPSIYNLLAKIIIPIKEKEEDCIWNPIEDGILTTKVAYKFKQARNRLRFNNIMTHWKTTFNAIIAEVSRLGNVSLKIGFIAMFDSNIVNGFNVKLNPPKSCIVKDFLWHPPILSWVKCNTDGASVGVSGVAACGGIYRDHSGNHLGRFSMSIGVGNALMTELTTATMTIEIAKDKNWNHLCNEIDNPLMSYDFDEASNDVEVEEIVDIPVEVKVVDDIPDTVEVEEVMANTSQRPQRTKARPKILQDYEVVGDDEVTTD